MKVNCFQGSGTTLDPCELYLYPIIDMSHTINDPFWKDDITILLNKHRLIEFVPTADMTANEKLNALTRLSLYVGILLTLVYKSSAPIYIPLITCAILYLVYEHYPDMISQSAGGFNSDHVQEPTKDNPFMNVLMTDYADNPQRKPAGDIDIPDIKEKINENFSHGLYKDVNNIWDKNNSQRQFYTNPSTTIPNDRDSFMKWCWKTPYTCKEGNLTRCLEFEDVRRHGQIN